MPSKNPPVVTVRGTPAYARYLDRLMKKVRASGVQNVESRHQLAEYALVVLGLNHGLVAPPRARPVGTNRHGEPKAGV